MEEQRRGHNNLPSSRDGNDFANNDENENQNENENEIPVIDLANPDASLLSEQIYLACSTWGFFQLINHGIPLSTLRSFRKSTADFFALPYKTKVGLKRDAANARGYFDDELTKRRRDWKEALDVGVPGSRDWEVLPDADGRNARCMDGVNRFPPREDEDGCPGFREAVVRYFEECASLSHRLACLMALALEEDGRRRRRDEEDGEHEGEDEEQEVAAFLERMRVDHTSYLRMNYYPPAGGGSGSADQEDDASASNPHNNSFSSAAATAPAEEGTLGISPHRDAGFLTVLLQDDDCHSLQVARFEDDDFAGDDDGDDGDRWVTVRPIPGALTVNTGDMAMMCSNGRFRAPLHRVLTDPRRGRYSAPFFYNPGYRQMIAPFAGCCRRPGRRGGADDGDLPRADDGDDLAPPKYRPCLWGYFRAVRFAGDLTDLGVEIQTSHFLVGRDTESGHVEKQRRFAEAVDFEEPFDVEKYRHILESKD